MCVFMCIYGYMYAIQCMSLFICIFDPFLVRKLHFRSVFGSKIAFSIRFWVENWIFNPFLCQKTNYWSKNGLKSHFSIQKQTKSQFLIQSFQSIFDPNFRPKFSIEFSVNFRPKFSIQILHSIFIQISTHFFRSKFPIYFMRNRSKILSLKKWIEFESVLKIGQPIPKSKNPSFAW